MKDVSEMTVYTVQTNNSSIEGKTFRMALHPMHDLPNNTKFHKKKYNFRVVFMNEQGHFSKGWYYSCLGKDVRQGNCFIGDDIGDDWDALQWLVDGEE